MKINDSPRTIIFGDSYASEEKAIMNNNISWSQMLKGSTINYGLCGSGTHYAIDKLFEYVDSDKYSKEDRIIVITSSSTRAIRYEDNKWPAHHVNITSDPDNLDFDDKELIEYLRDNQIAHDYILLNLLTPDAAYQTDTMLQAFLDALPNKTLLIRAFNISPKIKNRLEYYLTDIAYGEFSNKEEFNRMKSNGKRFADPRTNHMCECNLRVFANQIENFFESNDYSVFKFDEFTMNIIEVENRYIHDAY